VVLQLETVRGDDLALPALDFLVVELDHFAGVGTHHVIVVLVLGHLEHRVSAIEVVPLHEAGRLELRQYTVDRREPDILTRLDQRLVHVLGAEVPIARLVENLEDAQPRQGRLQSRFLEFLGIHGFDRSRFGARPAQDNIIAAPLAAMLRSALSLDTGRSGRGIQHDSYGLSDFLPVPSRRRGPCKQHPMTKRITPLFLILLLAGCSAPQMPSMHWLPSKDNLPFVHKIEVQQGNVVTQDMLAQLRSGMDKKKVTFIMGSPIVQDTFNADRWDYIFTHQPGGERPERRLVTLYFVDDKLESVGGDVAPASGELVATLHHDLTVRVPRFKPKNFVERVVDKIPFTGDDADEQKVEVLSVEEAASEHAEATAREAADAAAEEEDDLADALEQVVPSSPYEDIQAAPGEGVIVPPDAPSGRKKKGFFARLLGGLAADEDEDEDDDDYDAGDPKYRDITDQSNI